MCLNFIIFLFPPIVDLGLIKSSDIKSTFKLSSGLFDLKSFFTLNKFLLIFSKLYLFFIKF